MNIQGSDKESLIKQIKTHKTDIISVYRSADLKLYQKKITKDHWSFDKIKTFSNLKFQLKIPESYGLVDDTGNFLWFRQEIAKGSMNIIAYEVPMPQKDSIINTIISERDSIGKNHVPGQFEGTYMMTESAFTPLSFKTNFNGYQAFETRGKWVVKNDFMAGPFLNYTIIDKANNRLLVIDGFTFAPSIKKRDFMFELEAILKTLKI
jgi:hypothetical protein